MLQHTPLGLAIPGPLHPGALGKQSVGVPAGLPWEPLCQGCASPAGHEGLEQAGERREMGELHCCRAAARSGGPQRPPFCGRAERPREACVVFTGREELSKPTGNRQGCCNVFWTAGFKNQRLPLSFSVSLSPPWQPLPMPWH